MYVRATALALPLLLGLACKTTSSQSETSSGQTARTESGVTGDTQARTEPPVPQEAAPGGSSSSDATTPSATGGTATGSSASSDSSSSQGTLAEPGEEIKGHASDEVITGRIAKVSRRSISIAADTGEEKTLQLAPETTVVIDGQEAQRSQLQEGQEVRASFNQVYGRDVAVEVHAGEGALRSSDPGSSSTMDTDGSRSWESGAGSSGSGAGTGAGSTGTSDPAADPSQGSGRR